MSKRGRSLGMAKTVYWAAMQVSLFQSFSEAICLQWNERTVELRKSDE